MVVGSGLPPRYTEALQDIRTEELREQNRAREQRENDPALVKAQAKWDARVEKIRQARVDAEQKADETKKAARDREREAIDALGPRPALEEVAA